MKICNPYRTSGRWYRGNVHTHSDCSECGTEALESVVAYYRKVGYDFIAVTDHDVVTKASTFDAPDFITLTGQEVHAVPDPARPWDRHIIALGLQKSIPVQPTLEDQLARIYENGGLAVLAHPRQFGMPLEALATMRKLSGIEIYNGKQDSATGEGANLEYWDWWLTHRGSVWGFAADDSHRFPTHLASAWICVRADELSAESILRSIARGAFYSSAGPSFLDIVSDDEDGLVQVRCSSAETIRFVGAFGEVLCTQEAKGMTSGQLQLTGSERYVRIEIVDRMQRTAWSNPLFLNDSGR